MLRVVSAERARIIMHALKPGCSDGPIAKEWSGAVERLRMQVFKDLYSSRITGRSVQRSLYSSKCKHIAYIKLMYHSSVDCIP